MLVLSMVALAAPFAAAQTALEVTDENIGETIGVTCFGCHGDNGVSLGVVPSLRGRVDVADALLAFKNGQRHGSVMDRIAKGYSEREIDAVGRFFAEMGAGQ